MALKRACFSATVVALAALVATQDGVSTAGAARTKYLGKLGILPASREVVVEDFINYHRHEIGRPKSGQAVALDVRWASQSVAKGGHAILQVGLATGLAHDREQLRPLNISLVIDKSGSMASAEKLTRVKSALTTFVSQLRPTDIVSIVVFDSEASVLIPARPASDLAGIKSAIREIQPGSSTNINGGLMLGYQQALENYKKGWTNRVILLTDGIANVGVTDPKQIANGSLSFNDRGIDLSTIGVGIDLNQDLLASLAKSGRGLYHFVADSEDVEKVFVKEMQSLISPIATEPNLELDFGPGLQVDRVYGYSPTISGNKASFKLDNMNSGITQVVLVRVKAGEIRGRTGYLVKAKLSYRDVSRNKQIDAIDAASLDMTERQKDDIFDDSSVAKNYAIATLAQAVRDMAVECEAQRYPSAQRVLQQAIDRTHARYPNLEDEDIKRTLTLAEKYHGIIREECQRRGILEEGGVVGNNLIANGDFSLGNRGFTSEIDYIQPAANCLWAVNYTIAPRFNSPLLHRLIADREFAAPKRASGNEQMFYANAGGTQAMVVWSSNVRCRPNTTYKLRFQAISLTPGAEWIPTFEIRVNTDRSEPQAAGGGEFAGISTDWNSKSATNAKVSIVRMPIPHGGGIIGIGNIEMVEVSKDGL